MTLTADNVRVGVTGAIYKAPAGTTLPTDALASLNAAFEDMGYASEDGVTQSIGTDQTDIRAWQNGDTVRTVQTSHTLTYAFTMLETNEKVLEAYYGVSFDGVVEITGAQGTRGEWIIDVVDGSDQIRIVIPDGQVTDHGDVVYQNGDAIKYPMTITCYPDASGNKAYLYFLGAGS